MESNLFFVDENGISLSKEKGPVLIILYSVRNILIIRVYDKYRRKSYIYICPRETRLNIIYSRNIIIWYL